MGIDFGILSVSQNQRYTWRGHLPPVAIRFKKYHCNTRVKHPTNRIDAFRQRSENYFRSFFVRKMIDKAIDDFKQKVIEINKNRLLNGCVLVARHETATGN